MLKELTVQTKGLFNPVKVVRIYVERLGCKIDEPSWDFVADCVGDVEIEQGFIVQEIEHVAKLCALGKFHLVNQGGTLYCRVDYEEPKED